MIAARGRALLTGRRAAARAPSDRARTGLMLSAIALLHLAGGGMFVLFVLPSHYRGLGIGVAGLAYVLGLRHAFDADHIAAIDNTTRRLMHDGRRPLSVGFWFALGHSSVVVAVGIGIVVAERAVFGAVSGHGSGLQELGGVLGTVVSAAFLYLIAGLNLVVLTGIVKLLRQMRRGGWSESELERRLESRGLMYRLLGPLARVVTREWHMYPVGMLFGLGFDTATEVALLASTALLATQHLPFYAILCLPLLFTAGMTLMDTLDGLVMNLAYSWALLNPIRRIRYNLAVTGLSVAICLLVATVELLGLVSRELGRSAGALGWAAEVDLNTAGLVIAGLLVVCWAATVAYWRLGRVAER